MLYLMTVGPDVLTTAKAPRWAPAEIIKSLLIAEETGRDHSTTSDPRSADAKPASRPGRCSTFRTRISSIPASTQDGLPTLEGGGPSRERRRLRTIRDRAIDVPRSTRPRRHRQRRDHCRVECRVPLPVTIRTRPLALPARLRVVATTISTPPCPLHGAPVQ